MPPADPRVVARTLRERAWEHEIVCALERELPRLEPGEHPGSGLYLSTSEQRLIVLGDELRATVLHLVSTGGYDHRLLGEVQSVGPRTEDPETWQLRLLVRDPATNTMAPVEGEVAWFSRVLELHYQASGRPLPFESHIQA